MINLLPTEAKKSLALEQRLRFAASCFFAAAALCLLAVVAALPTGLLLSRYEASSAPVSGLAVELKKRSGDIEKDVEETRILIEHLSKKSGTREYSVIIEDLDGLAGSDISLTHFNFDDKKKLVLSGVAATRSGLSAFRDRLEKYELFKTAELPLSSLVKDTEVPFSITVTFK